MYNIVMKDDQFDKLFKYIGKRFDGMERRLENFEENMATKNSIDHLINTMDDFIRQITDNEVEQVARDAKFNRLVEWAREVSEKTGIPLPNL